MRASRRKSDCGGNWACFEKTDDEVGVIWLVVLVFEVNGRKIIQGTVSALAIVEGFDVIEDFGASLAVGSEVAAIDQFEFESAPEAFHGGVVVAVGFAAH